MPWARSTQVGRFVLPAGAWWNVHVQAKQLCTLHKQFASMWLHSVRWARDPTAAEQQLLRRVCTAPAVPHAPCDGLTLK